MGRSELCHKKCGELEETRPWNLRLIDMGELSVDRPLDADFVRSLGINFKRLTDLRSFLVAFVKKEAMA